MAHSFQCWEVVPIFFFTSRLCKSRFDKFLPPSVRGQQCEEGAASAQLAWIEDQPCWFWLPLLPAAIQSQVNDASMTVSMCSAACLLACLLGGYFISTFKVVACYMITVIVSLSLSLLFAWLRVITLQSFTNGLPATTTYYCVYIVFTVNFNILLKWYNN